MNNGAVMFNAAIPTCNDTLELVKPEESSFASPSSSVTTKNAAIPESGIGGEANAQ
ncbi:hypothetical protein [Noviherbaspirillum aerium]|uniref:hypothetical protein n=1 Tax=Noviherbaspirillum aerium TaxID=2588497 RepID=UPI00178C43CC|nr:hypothetical protein [Noviherbaspirillum aerium]